MAGACSRFSTLLCSHRFERCWRVSSIIARIDFLVVIDWSCMEKDHAPCFSPGPYGLLWDNLGGDEVLLQKVCDH